MNEVRIDCGAPSPAKSAEVEFDCYTVQCDGAFDRFGRERNQTALISKTQHEKIACDRVAEQTGSEVGGIEKFDVILAGCLANAPLHRLAGLSGTSRDPAAITLFKSLGIGLEDLAVASVVYDRAMASGRFKPL